ncbi:hypothetical protein [Vallitalea guaymasensis]|uniref:Uncharacterized protein n=1 Tax=Vallitalea guaymasensis TaxID=1185412 RepID=A0A8J8MAL6_9FIRM|nr:hypothetical protein [Vallitalea guaymasensis]QUH29388.1 hypothetical protein HYG85_10845 [Vallitalea guaymasensis]
MENNHKDYMDQVWKKVRWMEYERIQKDKAELASKLIKQRERKVKLKLFGCFSLIIMVFIILFEFDLTVILSGGAVLFIVALYYENIIERKIYRRIIDENMYQRVE